MLAWFESLCWEHRTFWRKNIQYNYIFFREDVIRMEDWERNAWEFFVVRKDNVWNTIFSKRKGKAANRNRTIMMVQILMIGPREKNTRTIFRADDFFLFIAVTSMISWLADWWFHREYQPKDCMQQWQEK